LPTYRAVVEYDGTEFAGFQVQAVVRTVGGVLEEALSALFDEPIKLTAAGRTDAGVHATGQVVSFTSGRAFPADRLPYALNAQLPADVSVRYADIAPDGFSARFDALSRSYEYTILNRPLPSAALRRFAHHVWQPIDLELVEAAAAGAVGQHDFAAFCGVLPERGGTVRTVHALDARRNGQLVELRVVGAGFLHRMVRILTGTLIEIGTGRRPPDDIPRILASRDRREAGYTAPPCGLRLVGARYPDLDAEAV
jgi:tRNA pseudouridine38-40 synthase